MVSDYPPTAIGDFRLTIYGISRPIASGKSSPLIEKDIELLKNVPIGLYTTYPFLGQVINIRCSARGARIILI
jgi:hypothetical protein